MTTTIAPTETELNDFLGRFVGDLGAALASANVILGDRLGLYAALTKVQPATAAEVATETATDERYVREWLAGQAAGGYVAYDDASGTYSMTPAQSFCLADPQSPAYLPGAFQLAASLYKDVDKLERVYRSGEGLGWHEHHTDLFAGTERFFRPGYVANLVESWLPALDGVVDKLTAGALVADIGCGHGASTIIMAQAFPQSRFIGFDYHPESIQRARETAAELGLDDRVSFEIGSAQGFPGTGYDLVAMFDCLHDMGDPVGAARHVRSALKDDGTWLIVEPNAADTLAENLNPVGRIFFSASSFICVPASRDQDVGLCLGAQAGEAKIGEVVTEGGFSQFRQATQTPFNLVLEARP
ncbi:MAG: hypothetical protein QOF92_1362 [Pseudonocardiales bacterium]|jgi:SAM-dependent methyltransferase|nr:hypothetical protein [Pseudonocardiales bacterium]MDT4928495.1 hypothetical protein [Pseudonocardiales bacterium]MDT4950317.1 hypothetical protein [Pseudonocardiales bacterium]